MNRKLSISAFVLVASLACTCGLFPTDSAPIDDESQITETETPLPEPLPEGPTETLPPTEAPPQDRILLNTQDELSDGYGIDLQFGGNTLEPWGEITAFQVLDQSDEDLQFIISFNVEGEWKNSIATAYDAYQFPPDSRVDFYGIGFYDSNVEPYNDDFFDVDNLGQHRINWTFDPGNNSFQGHYFFLEGNQWTEGNNDFISIEADSNSLAITTIKQDWMEGVYVYATMAVCAQACIMDIVGYQPESDTYELLLPATSSSAMATITLENNLDVPVCYARISSSSGGGLDNVLVGDGESITPGEILTTQVAIGEVIDIQIRDCDDEIIDELFGIEITPDGIYFPFSPSTGLGED